MPTKSFNISEQGFVQLANKLEKTHRSALPIAVRSTLNDAAFDMKKNELMPAFDKQFIIRKKNFIQSHTSVNKSSNTFDINRMVAKTGVIKGKSDSGDMLENQEFGGTIDNRENIPTPFARTSKSASKLVSRRNYLQRVRVINNKPYKTIKELRKAVLRHGKGKHFLFGKVLVRIRTINKRGIMKFTNLYAVDKNRSINLKKRPFLSVAGNKSAKKLDEFYAKNAVKQIQKYANK